MTRLAGWKARLTPYPRQYPGDVTRLFYFRSVGSPHLLPSYCRCEENAGAKWAQAERDVLCPATCVPLGLLVAPYGTRVRVQLPSRNDSVECRVIGRLGCDIAPEFPVASVCRNGPKRHTVRQGELSSRTQVFLKGAD